MQVKKCVRNKLAEKIESIIESVKPMANIGDIKIVDVNGLPGFVEQVEPEDLEVEKMVQAKAQVI